MTVLAEIVPLAPCSIEWASVIPAIAAPTARPGRSAAGTGLMNFGPVAGESRDDDLSSAGRAGGNHAAEPWPAPRMTTRSSGPVPGTVPAQDSPTASAPP